MNDAEEARTSVVERRLQFECGNLHADGNDATQQVDVGDQLTDPSRVEVVLDHVVNEHLSHRSVSHIIAANYLTSFESLSEHVSVRSLQSIFVRFIELTNAATTAIHLVIV